MRAFETTLASFVAVLGLVGSAYAENPSSRRPAFQAAYHAKTHSPMPPGHGRVAALVSQRLRGERASQAAGDHDVSAEAGRDPVEVKATQALAHAEDAFEAAWHLYEHTHRSRNPGGSVAPAHNMRLVGMLAEALKASASRAAEVHQEIARSYHERPHQHGAVFDWEAKRAALDKHEQAAKQHRAVANHVQPLLAATQIGTSETHRMHDTYEATDNAHYISALAYEATSNAVVKASSR